MEPFDSDSFRDRKSVLYLLSFDERLFKILDTCKLDFTTLPDITGYITNYITRLSKTEEEQRALLNILENLLNNTKQNSRGNTRRYYSFLDELLERKKSKIKMIDMLFIEHKVPISSTLTMNLSQEELDEYIFEDFTSPEPILTPTVVSHVFNLSIPTRDGSAIVFRGGGIPVHSSYKSQTASGEGAFGAVYKYSTSSLQRDRNSFNYMVKFAIPSQDGTIDDGNERKANQALRAILREQKRRCDIIHGRVITSEKHFAILMPTMDGDIYKLDIKTWSRMSKLKLLDTIRSQMECIIKLNSDEDLKNPLQNTFKFAYLDLKPGNILYKRRANGELTYKLGDLGGVVENDEKKPGEFMSTFPVHIFEKKEGKRVLVNGKTYHTLQFPNRHIIKCMRYVFGILAHMLFTNTLVNPGLYQRIMTLTDVQIADQQIRLYYGDDYSDLMYDSSTETRLSMYN
jgi:hypothetical protein